MLSAMVVTQVIFPGASISSARTPPAPDPRRQTSGRVVKEILTTRARDSVPTGIGGQPQLRE